jgi:hypothetical protein
MRPYFCELYRNPVHAFFRRSGAEKIDEARKRTAALLGALPERSFFRPAERKATMLHFAQPRDFSGKAPHCNNQSRTPRGAYPCRNLSSVATVLRSFRGW